MKPGGRFEGQRPLAPPASGVLIPSAGRGGSHSSAMKAMDPFEE